MTTQSNTHRDDIHAEAYFADEEDVRQINCVIPEDIYEDLRKESIERTGTTQHMGQIVTSSMAAHLQPKSHNTSHKTYSRLKEMLSGTESNVDEWTYETYVDYSDSSVDKRHLCVSVPQSIVRDFTEHLNEGDYGEMLANAINSELTKREQIRLMHKRLDGERGEVDNVDTVETDIDGIPVDVRELRMSHVNAEAKSIDPEKIGDYKSRRGAIMARVRTGRIATKEDINNLSKEYGASTRPTRRKDYLAIRQHIRTDENERFELHPAIRVMDEMEFKQPLIDMGLTSNNAIVEKYEVDEEASYELNMVCYDSQCFTEREMWEGFIVGGLNEYAKITLETKWENPGHINLAMAKKRNLQQLIPVYETSLRIVQTEEFEGSEQVAETVRDVIELLDNELCEVPRGLDAAYQNYHAKNERKHGENTPSPLTF